jgi:hypothetical protein
VNEIITEKFPNLKEEMDIQVHATLELQRDTDWKRTSSHCIIVKIPRIQNKGRILKDTRDRSAKLLKKANNLNNSRQALGMMVHTCHLSYSGGSHQKDHSSSPAWTKRFARSCLNRKNS